MVLFTLYSASEKNQKIQSDILALQTRVETIKTFLQKSIYLAGFSGCSKLSWNEKIIQTDPDPDSEKNSDTLTVIYASSESELLARDMRGYGVFYLPKTLDINRGDQLIISDCQSMEHVTVKKISETRNHQFKIIPTQLLKHLYSKSAEAHFYVRDTYFVGKTDHDIDALYWRDRSGEKSEIAENVIDMHVERSKKMIFLKFDFETFLFKKTIFVDVGLRNVDET